MSSERRIPCPLCCNECFPDQESLRNHLIKTVKNVTCPVCYQTYDNVVNLSHHAQCVPLTERMYKGVFTDVQLSDKTSEITLQKDFVAIVSIKIPDTFTEQDFCEDIIEDETPKLKSNLRPKLKVQPKKRKFQKRKAKKRFKNVEKKIRTEDSNKYDPLDISSVGEEPSNLKTEIKEEQFSDDEYSCSACNMSFTSIVDHIKEYHPGKVVQIEGCAKNEENTPVLLKCAYCSSSFNTKKEIRNHVALNHNRFERVKCNDCLCYFLNSKALKSHLQNKHGADISQRKKANKKLKTKSKNYAQKKFKEHDPEYLIKDIKNISFDSMAETVPGEATTESDMTPSRTNRRRKTNKCYYEEYVLY